MKKCSTANVKRKPAVNVNIQAHPTFTRTGLMLTQKHESVHSRSRYGSHTPNQLKSSFLSKSQLETVKEELKDQDLGYLKNIKSKVNCW